MKRSILLMLMICTLASCSRKSEHDLLKEGADAYGQKNYTLAIEKYNEVVDRYPSTVSAESALYHLAAIYSNDLHESRHAVGVYQQFYTMFPSSPEAPTALFLTGFLYNNELHIIDSARIVYELFLQKYPEHSLAGSAKFELATLGRDPGEFLQSQTASSETDHKETKSSKQ